MKTARQARHDAHGLWRLCLTETGLDEARARLVIDQIIESRPAGALAVLKQFVRLVRLDVASRSATVASATPLDEGVRAEIVAGLARLRGRPIDTTFVVDPTLIGGMRVHVGNDVYDGSIRSGLAALESRF
jgi:F-type H+-transporting ATPase subunit delta